MRTWRQMAAQGLLGAPRVMPDRQLVFERGNAATSAYFLVDGFVEIFQGLEDGRSLVVRLLTAPCVFGVLETCAAEPRYLESMRVLDHAILHQIEAPRFYALLRQHPAAALECLATTAMAFCRVADTETARLVETETLLAAAILAYAELFGEETPQGRRILLRRSQADLAAVVGASERQVQRIFATWKDAVLTKQRGRYLVRDIDLLRQLAGEYAQGLVHRVEQIPTWVYG